MNIEMRILDIERRLNKIEKWRKEQSESTDWQEEAQNKIDELDHGAY